MYVLCVYHSLMFAARSNGVRSFPRSVILHLMIKPKLHTYIYVILLLSNESRHRQINYFTSKPNLYMIFRKLSGDFCIFKLLAYLLSNICEL